MSSVAGAAQSPAIDHQLATQKDNVDQLSEISKNSQTTFIALVLACVYSYLAIATTTDAALMSNSSATPLPIIQVNVPIVWFYYFAPIILAMLFVYFHLYLERFWRCVARLPLWHPDGRGLDDYVYPWLISSTFIRGGIPQLSAHRVSARLEAWLSLLLAWWLVPIVLLFYWARYLVAHDWPGTLLHLAIIFVTTAFALRFFCMARNALREMAKNRGTGSDNSHLSASALQLSRSQLVVVGCGMVVLMAALLYLSAAAIRGLSDKSCNIVGVASGCGFYSPGQRAWEGIGIAPRSEVKEERFVAKPERWLELLKTHGAINNYLETQRTLVLDRRDLRNMSARNAFLPGSRVQRSSLEYADLQHAVLTGSRLEDVSLRGANLTDADLQYAQIINVRFDDVDAHAARFDHANFTGATSDTRTRLSGDFSGASFDDASGDQLQFGAGAGQKGDTSLRETTLLQTRFAWATFQGVDLSGARIEDATMTNSMFTDTDFSRAIIRGARLDDSTFTKCRFISPEIQDSFFEYAKFVDSQFDHTAATLPEGDQATLPRAPRKTISGFQGSSAQFIGTTSVRNVQFAKADLRFVEFKGVQFDNITFLDSDLSYAKFRDTDLAAVEFAGVDLSDADLTKARNVSPRLLAGACGNARTQLPSGMKVKPCHKK